jgi:hypothetical protein
MRGDGATRGSNNRQTLAQDRDQGELFVRPDLSTAKIRSYP